jgi:hypothetical protein
VSFLERRARHHAEELVAAEADDQVVGTQVIANRVDRGLEQLVAGGMSMRVVDRLQSHDVDIGDDEFS